MRAKSHEWRACANCLAGHPAFILGNGPTLPQDLSTVKDYFTVGVNRILYHFDPTVLMWFDQNVGDDIAKLIRKSEAIVFTNETISGRHNGLRVNGTREKWDDTPLAWPDYVPGTGSSGVSAAYWAMSLGCSPIYLLGMSAEYVGDRTSSYGRNKWHRETTLVELQRALAELLKYKHVYPILDQAQLETITTAMADKAEGRTWYKEMFAACHDQAQPLPLRPPYAKPLSLQSAILGQIIAEAADTLAQQTGPRGTLHIKTTVTEDRQRGARWDAIIERLHQHCPEPKLGAEIGVWEARTTKHLLREFPGLTMYMVDPWPDKWPEDSRYWQSGDATPRMDAKYIRTRYQAALRDTEFAADRRIVLRLMSVDAAPAVPDRTLDFVFLDGEHSKEAVSEDLDAWWPKVRNGGIVCGHDWEHPEFPVFGVREAIEAFVGRLGQDISLELGADLTWFIIKD